MVHPEHPDWVTPALSPCWENRVKMSEIRRSKTRVVIDTDPLPNEEWPRKLGFKIRPGNSLRRLWWRPVESWVSGKEWKRCTVCSSFRRAGGPQRKPPNPWFSKIKRYCSSQELSWRTYQSMLWVLEVLVLKRRKSRFRGGGRAKYIETLPFWIEKAIWNRKSLPCSMFFLAFAFSRHLKSCTRPKWTFVVVYCGCFYVGFLFTKVVIDMDFFSQFLFILPQIELVKPL